MRNGHHHLQMQAEAIARTGDAQTKVAARALIDLLDAVAAIDRLPARQVWLCAHPVTGLPTGPAKHLVNHIDLERELRAHQPSHALQREAQRLQRECDPPLCDIGANICSLLDTLAECKRLPQESGYDIVRGYRRVTGVSHSALTSIITRSAQRMRPLRTSS
jgi:hypothetical protein